MMAVGEWCVSAMWVRAENRAGAKGSRGGPYRQAQEAGKRATSASPSMS